MAVALSLVTGSYAADEAIAADSPAQSAVRDLSAYYEKPGVDLSQYTAILLDNLSVDDARVLPPPWYQGADSGLKKWQLTDADLQWLRKSYREAMRAEITGKGGYPIVDEPGKGVLILDVAIISLMPYARKGEEVETRGFGEMLVQAQLRDGMTEELLAVYEGKQEVGSGYQQNTRLNNENSLRELFQVWGMRMRGILDTKKLD
jgi:hypothetical protein